MTKEQSKILHKREKELRKQIENEISILEKEYDGSSEIYPKFNTDRVLKHCRLHRIFSPKFGYFSLNASTIRRRLLKKIKNNK